MLVPDPDACLRQLDTESVRPDLADLDQWSVQRLVGLMAEENAAVAVAVAAAGESIVQAAEVMISSVSGGGRVVYVGAGTSGRLAVIDAVELIPTFGMSPGQVVAVIAGGDSAMFHATEDAEDDSEQAKADIVRINVGPQDVVVGVTASGRTPYVVAAVDTARSAGASTICVCNNARSALSSCVDCAIEILTGPEVVAGSTRMKAGTAQKVVLNMLSTILMIRLGKIYRNLMVDMQATNAKLRRRALDIVMEATGVDERQASEATDAAAGDVKTAIVSLLAAVDANEARSRLARNGGMVRGALEDA